MFSLNRTGKRYIHDNPYLKQIMGPSMYHRNRVKNKKLSHTVQVAPPNYHIGTYLTSDDESGSIKRAYRESKDDYFGISLKGKHWLNDPTIVDELFRNENNPDIQKLIPTELCSLARTMLGSEFPTSITVYASYLPEDNINVDLMYNTWVCEETAISYDYWGYLNHPDAPVLTSLKDSNIKKYDILFSGVILMHDRLSIALHKERYIYMYSKNGVITISNRRHSTEFYY